MSNTIDRKVVEMRFDNQNFERNVQQSIKTTTNMTESLNKLERNKSLEAINSKARKVDFSPMSSGINKVEASFSALQAAGFTVINRLTNKALDFGKNLLHNTFGQIKSGGVQRALNLEQAEFQVTGLAKDLVKTDKRFKKSKDVWVGLLDDVNYAVDGTAYGLDEASKVGSQLMASNVKIGKDMKEALRGVSGMAAMTGRSYSEIGNIYTKIAGNGRLMSQELLQFSASGINAASTLTKFANSNKAAREQMIKAGLASKQAKNVQQFAKSTELTEQNIRTLVSAGAVDFKTFSKAMDSAFGEHATKANETYTGSLSNLKAALSRIGEPIATDVFDNLKDLFNTIQPKLKEIKNNLKPLYDFLHKTLSDLTKSATNYIKQLDFSGGAIVTFTGKLRNVVSFIKDVFKTISEFKIIFEPIKDIFVDVKNLLSGIFSSDRQTSMENIQNFVKKLAVFLRNLLIILEFIIRKSTPALIKVAKTLGTVFKFLGRGIFTVVEFLKDLVVELDNTGKYTQSVSKISTTFNKIIRSISNGFKSLFKSAKPVANTVKKAGKKGSALDSLKGMCIDLYNTLMHNKSNILNAGMLGAFTLFYKQLGKIINGFMDKVMKPLNNLEQSLSQTIKNISNTLTQFYKAKAREANINSIKSLAISIGIIAASLYLISKINTDDLVKSLVALTVVIIEVAILFKIINSSFSKDRLQGAASKSLAMAVVFTALSFAMVSLALALKIMTTADLNKMLAAGLVMLALMSTLLIAVYVMSEKAKELSPKDAIQILALKTIFKSLSKAILMIAIALRLMASADLDKMLVAGITMLAFMSTLLIALYAMSEKAKELSPKDAVQILALKTTFKALSKAILIIAIALRLMASADLTNLIASAIITFSLLITMLGVVLIVAHKARRLSPKDAISIANLKSVFIALGYTMLIISQAIKNIAQNDIVSTIVSTMAIIALLTTLTKMVAKTRSNKASLKGVASLIALGLIVKSLFKVMASISKSDPLNVAVAAGAMYVMVISLAKLMKRISDIDFQIDDLVALGSISSLIGGLSEAIKVISQIKFPEILAGLTSMLIVLFAVSKFLEKIDSIKLKASSLAAMFALSVILYIIASSIKVLAAVSVVEAVIAIATIIALAGAVVVLALAAKMMQPMLGTLVKFGFVLIELGAAMFLAGVGMAALAAGLAGLVAIGPEGIDKLIEMFAQLMAASTLYTIKYKEVIIKGLISLFDVVIDFLMRAIPKLLVIIPPLMELIGVLIESVCDLLVKYVGPIVDTIITFIIKIIKGVANRIGDLFSAIGELVGSIGKEIVKALNNASPAEIMKLVLSIGIIALIFTGISYLKSQMIQALIVIGIMSAALLALTGVFALMSLIPMNLQQTLSSLALFMISMAATMVLCALIPAPAAISAVISLGVFIAGLIVVLTALGAISQIPGLKWIIGEGGELLAQLGYIIGRFISSILEGLSAGFPAIMANLAAGLINLSVGLIPFCKAISKIPLDGVIKLGILAAIVAVITAVGFIESIMKFSILGDPIDAFVAALIKLAIGLESFGKITSKLNTDEVMKLAITLGILADVQTILAKNKLISFFTGEVDYKGFEKGIVGMAKALKKFCTTMADEKVDAKRMLTFAQILKNLALVQHYMPRKGGWMQEIVGTTDVTMFSDGCDAMIKALADIEAQTKTIKDPQQLDFFLGLLKKVVKIVNAIPNSGGWAGWLMGDKDIEGFGDGTKSMAEGFKDLADKTAEIKDPKKLDVFIGLLKKVAEIQNALPKTNGAAQWWGGEKDLEDLAEGMSDIADMFTDLDKSLKKANLDNLDKFVTMVSLVASAEKTMSKVIKDNTDKESDEYTDPISRMVDPLKKGLAKIKDLTTKYKADYLIEAQTVFDGVYNFINNIGDKFANYKTMAKVKAITDVSKSIQSVVEAIKSVKSLGLSDFGFSDIQDSKSKVLSAVEFNSGSPVTKDESKADTNYFGGLAKAMIDFGSAMKKVDLETLKEAKLKIDLVRGIKDFKKGKFENLKSSISNLKGAVEDIQSLYNKLIGKGSKEDGDFTSLMPSGIPGLSSDKSEDKKTKKGVEDTAKYFDVITQYARDVRDVIVNIQDMLSEKKIKADKINKFSEVINTFSEAMKKVADALDAVSKTPPFSDEGNTLKNTLNTVGSASVSAFLKPIREGKGVKTTVSKSFKAFENSVLKKMNALGPKEGSLYLESIKVGGYILDGMITGIEDKSDDLEKAIKKAAKGVVKSAQVTLEIKSPSRVFKRIGRFTIDGYIKGVNDRRLKAIKATSSVFSESIKAAKKQMVAGGSYLKGYIKQFYSNYDNMSKKNKKLAIATSAAKLQDTAVFLYKQTDAFKEDSAAVASIKKRLKKYNKVIKDFNRKNPTTEDGRKYKDYKIIYERAKRARKAAEKAEKNAGKATASTKKTTKGMSKEEKAEIKRQNEASKKATANANKNAQKSAKKRLDEAKKAEEKAKKKFDKYKAKLDNAKSSKKDLKQEYKDLKKQIANNIAQALQDFKDSIKDNIASFMGPDSASLDLGVDFFAGFEKQGRISTEKMLKNNRDAVKAVEQYQKDLETLSSKGFDPLLVQQLKSKGISAWAEVKAYLAMNDAQKNESNKLFKKNAKQSTDQMTQQLKDNAAMVKYHEQQLNTLIGKGLDRKVIKEILTKPIEEQQTIVNGLLQSSSGEIKEFSKAYKNALEAPEKEAKNLVTIFAQTGKVSKKKIKEYLNKDTGKSAGKDVCSGISQGIKENRIAVKNSFEKLATNYSLDPYKNALGIHSPSTKFKEAAKWCVKGLSKGVETNASTASGAFGNLADDCIKVLKNKFGVDVKDNKVKKGKTPGGSIGRKLVADIKLVLKSVKKKDWHDLGVNLSADLIDGIGEGIADTKKGKATNKKIAKLCQSIGNAFRSFFKMHSPSRVTAEMGGFLTEGLGVGILEKEDIVIKAVNRLSASVASALDSIGESTTPVITPVVDLSDIEDSVSAIDSMFNNDIAMKASASFKEIQNQKNNVPVQNITNNYNNEFNQNNYSPEALSRIDIYRDTKGLFNQAMRGGAPA